MPRHLLALIALSLSLCACSTPSADSLAANDPFEPVNRDVFAFDVWVEHNVARPVAQGYRDVVPEPARDGVHNVIVNLHAPVVLANDVLQGRAKKAVHTAARIVINSTIGLGGLFDVAARLGIPYHDNDFGVTLGRAGVDEGPYVVLPLLGPRPPRDLAGGFVDGLLDPISYSRFDARNVLLTARWGAGILDAEDRRMDQIAAIERTSVDFYATTRSFYRQSRDSQIRGDDVRNLGLPDL